MSKELIKWLIVRAAIHALIVASLVMIGLVGLDGIVSASFGDRCHPETFKTKVERINPFTTLGCAFWKWNNEVEK